MQGIEEDNEVRCQNEAGVCMCVCVWGGGGGGQQPGPRLLNHWRGVGRMASFNVHDHWDSKQRAPLFNSAHRHVA
jgi:hypothetical protein